MKNMKKLVALLLAVMMLMGIAPSVSAAVSAELENIIVTELSLRYDDDVDAEYDTKNTKGSAMGAVIWSHYMLVPVNYTGKCNDMAHEKQSQIFVYDMQYNTPRLLGRYDKEDLGITVRNTSSRNDEDFIYGMHIDNDYMYVGIEAKTADNNYDAGVFVYKNPLTGGTLAPLEKVESLQADSYLDCTKTADIHRENNSAPGNGNGWKMQSVKSGAEGDTALITMYGFQWINSSEAKRNGFFTVTSATGEQNEIFYYDEFLKFTKEGTEYGVDRIYDMVFEGDKAYILALTDKPNDYIITNGDSNYSNYYAATFAIYTVSFERPFEPQITDISLFASDFAHDITKDVSGNATNANAGINSAIRAFITVSEGYAYVTTNNHYNYSGLFDESRPHIFILEQKDGGFSQVCRYKASQLRQGLGEVQVIGDILIGRSATTSTHGIKARLSEDRTEILEFVYETGTYDTSGSTSLLSTRYKSKAIFVCPEALSNYQGDTNRAVVDIVDVVSAGGDWEEVSGDKKNTSLEGLYAVFEKDYLYSGLNTLLIKGSNITGGDLEFCVILALYENGVLADTVVSRRYGYGRDEEINISESIDLTSIEDLSSYELKAFLWENMNTVKPLASAISPKQTVFTFTLDEAASTSAGVYDEDDCLIRTLWSGVPYEIGEYTMTWDGLDDFGNVVPDGNYTVKVQSNNVVWEKLIPVIGNTTDCTTWDSFISSYNSIFDMAYDTAEDRFYYCSDHVEGGIGLRYLNGDDISRNGGLIDGCGNRTATNVASDGNVVYWGSAELTMNYSSNEIKTFIHATLKDEDVLENTGKDDIGQVDFHHHEREYMFDYGTPVASKWGETTDLMYQSAINYFCTTDIEAETGVDMPYNRIGGLEVQQEGSYLFSAYRDLNKVFVNNKTTGELLHEYDLTEPSAMAMSRSDDNTVYLAYRVDGESGNTFNVAKYTVESDGSLAKTKDVVTDISNPIIAMAISPDGKILAIAEGGNADTVRVYDTTDFNEKFHYGTGESYYTDPTVKDGKLMFDDGVFKYGLYEHSFLEFVDNDSLFIGDSGNTRIYKMDVGGAEAVYEDMLAFMSNTYSVSVVANNTGRIFCDRREFSIDYDKLEEYMDNRADRYDYDGFRDAWKLEKNYKLYLLNKYPETEANASIMSVFFRPTTINDYTYFGIVCTDGTWLFKQSADGEITKTDISLKDKDLDKKGNIWYRTNTRNVARYYKQELTGFLADGTPTYAPERLMAEIDMNVNTHLPYQSDPFMATTDDGKLFVHEAAGPEFSQGNDIHMHLGMLDVSGDVATEFKWIASPRTMNRNESDFPMDGFFDYGNSTGYTTKFAFEHNGNVMFHYRGEGYKGRQANSFVHFSEIGLFVTTFNRNLTGRGDDYEWTGAIKESQPCNSMSCSIAANPKDSDIAYVYQNTEGAAGGVHVTRITGLNSIKVQEMPIVKKTGIVDGVAYTCYEGTGCDIVNAVNRGVSNDFNIPYITDMEGTPRSVRFEGYFVPEYTDEHRISIDTDGKVKMLLDNVTVINGEGENSFKVYMEKDRFYRFTLEVSTNENNELSYLNMGHMLDNVYRYVDNKTLKCKYPEPIEDKTINLLDGFTYGAAFESGMYGWTVDTKNSQVGNKTDIRLNVLNYHYYDTPDLYMNITVAKQEDETVSEIDINRNLGEVYSPNWKIDMDLRYTGNTSRTSDVYIRAGSNDGSSIELYDASGYLIADLVAYHNPWQADFAVLGNGETLFLDPKLQDSYYSYMAIQKNQQQKLAVPNNFTIEPDGEGYVKMSFGGNEPVRVAARDSRADVYAPAEVKFVWYCHHPSGRNNAWDVTKFDFIQDTTK